MGGREGSCSLPDILHVYWVVLVVDQGGSANLLGCNKGMNAGNHCPTVAQWRTIVANAWGPRLGRMCHIQHLVQSLLHGWPCSLRI